MEQKPKKPISRKSFLTLSGLATAGVGLMATGCTASTTETNDLGPSMISGKRIRWNMVTTWPPGFPVLGEGCRMLADIVSRMSGGQLEINVYGGGELIPALEAFDAVSSRTADIGSGASYYWAGKSKASQFFAAFPFGFNAQQMNTWLYCGGGLELWNEVYEPFNVIPMPGGNTGTQMAGWFNRQINSMEDIKGLKMRIPGLGGKVLQKAGGTAVLSAGSEIYTNLERGVIDATEWIGPYHDYLMGFHEIARYYYYPGWHEPGTVLEFFINKRSFEELPVYLQEIVRTATYRTNLWMLCECEMQNAVHLNRIRESSDAEILRLPDEVLRSMKLISAEVMAELISDDPLSRKVYDSVRKFKDTIAGWVSASEKEFYVSVG